MNILYSLLDKEREKFILKKLNPPNEEIGQLHLMIECNAKKYWVSDIRHKIWATSSSSHNIEDREFRIQNQLFEYRLHTKEMIRPINKNPHEQGIGNENI